MMVLKISGKTYAEKKENLRELAKESQILSNEEALSWGELAEMYTFFEKNAKKYGLIKEFRENAII